ncbi:hypothetical protein SSP35_19_00900 [Streptomyces sp. NBRC 110611]|nr:hypothetical protein SSP35_19_00900 [Streptomyces sp. NBRC 110611]
MGGVTTVTPAPWNGHSSFTVQMGEGVAEHPHPSSPGRFPPSGRGFRIPGCATPPAAVPEVREGGARRTLEA